MSTFAHIILEDRDQPLTLAWPATGNAAAFLHFDRADASRGFIAGLEIDGRIPEITQLKFARAQTLYLLNWIDFSLIKAGELAALIALERAVMDRHGGELSKRKRGFAALLKHMVTADGLTDSDIPMVERCGGTAIGQLVGDVHPTLAERRNILAHGDPFVLTSKHDLTIHSYLDDVIVPALATLDSKIAELGASDWPGHQFAQADMEAMKSEAILAFGLSIQSIWERQLRSYLRGCANELRPGEPIAGKIDKANWQDLQKWFRRLRGINLDEFPSFPLLDILQHLGNACRHGDGDSAMELYRRRPDLWPVIPPMPPGFGEPQVGPAPPPAGSMEIPVAALREFVTAIAAFWRDAKYIYNERIERKHENLEAHLVKQRAERTWFPQARSEAG